MMQTKKKILLVQLFSNGDCLYATTVAKQIKVDFPGCYLSWLIAEHCANIIKHNPYVDEIITTKEVVRMDVTTFHRLKRKVKEEETSGKWDKVFITHNSQDGNQGLYDGTVRGMIFRAYPNPITVPVQPELILSEVEKQRVQEFAVRHQLHKFKHVILWEYAPLSGQVVLSPELVRSVSQKIVQTPDTCIILSSANAFQSTEKIIDASSLTLRENAALTHFCHLLIGCSSGITWISTSTAGKMLPMLQLLDSWAYFRNAPSEDFKRYGISTDNLIEIFQFDEDKIYHIAKSIFEKGITKSKEEFNEALPVQFKTTRKVVYNLLCFLQIISIIKHYRINTSVYGLHPLFLKEFVLAFVTFPLQLVSNKWRKWIASRF